MVESNEKKPIIVVMGTLGVGKSTFLNTLLGEKTEYFETSGGVDGCTQKFTSCQWGDYLVMDTPGLNDPKLDVVDWVATYNGTAAIKS
jgi:putative ribosome biogenesis GTPase RsgA